MAAAAANRHPHHVATGGEHARPHADRPGLPRRIDVERQIASTLSERAGTDHRGGAVAGFLGRLEDARHVTGQGSSPRALELRRAPKPRRTTVAVWTSCPQACITCGTLAAIVDLLFVLNPQRVAVGPHGDAPRPTGDRGYRPSRRSPRAPSAPADPVRQTADTGAGWFAAPRRWAPGCMCRCRRKRDDLACVPINRGIELLLPGHCDSVRHKS